MLIDRRQALLGMSAMATAALAPSGVPAEGEAPSRTWTTAAPLPSPRTEVSLASDETRLYLAGGLMPNASGEPEAATDLLAWESGEDRWTLLGDLPEGVHHAGLVHLDGLLFLVGGFSGAGFAPTGAVRAFELSTGRWADGPLLPTPRGALALVAFEGRLHAIGGSLANGRDSAAHEVLDLATGTWTAAAPLPVPRNHHAAGALGGRIAVVAGRDAAGAAIASTWIWDRARDAWTEAAPVPTSRSGAAAAVFGQRLALFGGEAFDPPRTFATAEAYDPATDRWEVLPPMPTARHGAGAAALGGWLHVVAGGPEAGFFYSEAHEVLDLWP